VPGGVALWQRLGPHRPRRVTLDRAVVARFSL
jgi:hypothetical protein